MSCVLACFLLFMTNHILDYMSEHTDLVDDLYSHRNSEKEVLLANPDVYAVIASGAEVLGITPEEYLDCLDAMLSEDPEEILGMLHRQSKEQQGEKQTDKTNKE